MIALVAVNELILNSKTVPADIMNGVSLVVYR
jgi:hypothetical protein